jgi:hypothetical protein
VTAVREQIFAAIETALGAVSGVEEVERMPSGDPASFPALHIFDQGDRPETGEAGTHRFLMMVGIDGYVSGGAGAAAHAAANDLYAGVIEALFAEPVLGGLATEIDIESLEVMVAERANTRRVTFSLDLSIHYATRRGSPQVID